jgi:hypothetical protein
MARGQGSEVFKDLGLHEEVFICSLNSEVDIVETLD